MSITNVAYPAISILLIYVPASSNSGRSVLNAARWPPSSCTLPLQPKHTHMLVVGGLLVVNLPPHRDFMPL